MEPSQTSSDQTPRDVDSQSAKLNKGKTPSLPSLSADGSDANGATGATRTTNVVSSDRTSDIDSMDVDPPPMGHDPNVQQRIPVYFSRQLASQLTLLQYPVRRRQHPYTGTYVPSEARLKPKSLCFELDIPLQTHALWYNRDRGKELALGVNDKEAKTIFDKDDWDFDLDDLTREHDNVMDRQTLQATVVTPQAKYMIGVIDKGELHLTPVHVTFQLRPGLKYLDRIDEKQKAANKKASEEEATLKERPSSNDDLGVGTSNATSVASSSPAAARGKTASSNKTVQLSVKSTDPDQQNVRKNNFSLVNKHADAEKWITMKYYDLETEEATQVYERMIANNRSDLVSKTSTGQYVQIISPQTFAPNTAPSIAVPTPQPRPAVNSAQPKPPASTSVRSSAGTRSIGGSLRPAVSAQARTSGVGQAGQSLLVRGSTKTAASPGAHRVAKDLNPS